MKKMIHKVLQYPDAKHIIVSGDIHGGFTRVVFKLCMQYGCTDTLLIIAGDCGFGFEKLGYYDRIYNKVAGQLRKANNWVVFLRGNHDDPSYFSEEKISYKRWRTIPDYGIIQACGHNILCIGGATSIDRYRRKEENARLRKMGHKDVAMWWPDEAPVYNEETIDFIPVELPIDIVISHTAPSFCKLKSHQGIKSWAVMDPSLIWDVDAERETMDRINKRLKEQDHPITQWIYGHFHQSWSGVIDGIRFAMLDIEEFKLIQDE